MPDDAGENALEEDVVQCLSVLGAEHACRFMWQAAKGQPVGRPIAVDRMRGR